MKVQLGEPEGFRPIIITLDEGDAWALWHVLNCSPSQSFDDYCVGRVKPSITDMRSRQGEVWRALDDILQPYTDGR